MDTSFYDAAEASMDTTEERDIAVSLASPKRRKTLASENKNNTFKVARNWVALFEDPQNLAKLDADMAALEAEEKLKDKASKEEDIQIDAFENGQNLAKLDADMAALEAKERAKEIAAIEKERMQVTACEAREKALPVVLDNLLHRGKFKEAELLARMNKASKEKWDEVLKAKELRYIRIMRQCTVLEAWEVECDSTYASDHTGPAVIQAAAHARSHDERRTRLCIERGLQGSLDMQKAGIWNFLFVDPPILSLPSSPPSPPQQQPQLQNVMDEEHWGSDGVGSGSSLFLIITTFASSAMVDMFGTVAGALEGPVIGVTDGAVDDSGAAGSVTRRSSSSSSADAYSMSPLFEARTTTRAEAVSSAIAAAHALLEAQCAAMNDDVVTIDFWMAAAGSVLCCHSAEEMEAVVWWIIQQARSVDLFRPFTADNREVLPCVLYAALFKACNTAKAPPASTATAPRMDPTAQTSQQEQQAGPPPAAEEHRRSPSISAAEATAATAAHLVALRHCIELLHFYLPTERQIAKHRAADPRRRAAAAARVAATVAAAAARKRKLAEAEAGEAMVVAGEEAAAAAASASEGVGAAESEEEVAMDQGISRASWRAYLTARRRIDSKQAGFTEEQRKVVKWHGGWSSGDSDSDHGELRGSTLVVEAVAGSGKTTVALNQIAEVLLRAWRNSLERPGTCISTHCLFLVFNKNPQREVTKKLEDIQFSQQCKAQTMDSLAKQYLTDCAFLPNNSAVDAPELKDFIRRHSSGSVWERDMRRRDGDRHLFVEFVNSEKAGNEKPVRAKILILIAKTLSKFLQSNDSKFIESDGEYRGHDYAAKVGWREYLRKRQGEDVKATEDSAESMLGVNVSCTNEIFIGDEDYDIEWVKYAKILFRLLFEEAAVKHSILNFELNTKLLQMRTQYKSVGSRELNLCWTKLGLDEWQDDLSVLKPLSLCDKYSQVTIDEAQDLNEAQYDLFVRRQQNLDVVLFGDKCQAIYSFKGAGRSIFSKSENLSYATVMHLTRVWRFGGQIAEKSTALLSEIYDRGKVSPPILIGRGAALGRVMSHRAREQLLYGRSYEDPGTIIVRTNAELLSEALKLSLTLVKAQGRPSQSQNASQCERPIHCILPDTGQMFTTVTKLAKLRTRHSKNGEQISGRNFRTFDDVVLWADEEENTNLLTCCTFAIEISGGEDMLLSYELVTKNLKHCKEMCKFSKTRPQPGTYRYLISNVHQMKGDEEDIVFLGEDFIKTVLDFRIGHSHSPHQGASICKQWIQEECNVLYVAMTRAKKILVLNCDLDRLFFKICSPPIITLRPRGGGAEGRSRKEQFCDSCSEPLQRQFAAHHPSTRDHAASSSIDEGVQRSRASYVRVGDDESCNRRTCRDFCMSMDSRYHIERLPLVLKRDESEEDTGTVMTEEGAGIPSALAGGGPVCVKCLISRGNTTSHGDEEVGAGGVGEGEEKGNEAVPAGLLHSVMKFWVGRFAENLDIGDTPQQ